MRCLYYVAVCCAVLNFGLAAGEYRLVYLDRVSENFGRGVRKFEFRCWQRPNGLQFSCDKQSHPSDAELFAINTYFLPAEYEMRYQQHYLVNIC